MQDIYSWYNEEQHFFPTSESILWFLSVHNFCLNQEKRKKKKKKGLRASKEDWEN